MEAAQRALLLALLEHLHSLGLLSDAARSGAADLVRSAADLPAFFQYPAYLPKEVTGHECAQNTQ